MSQQSINKLVVLEVSPVAASMDKRRQPENPEVVQREPSDRLRPRHQHRNRQKPPLGQEVMHSPAHPPVGRLRRAKLRTSHSISSFEAGRSLPALSAARDAVASKELAVTSLRPPGRLRKRVPAAPMPMQPRPVPIRQLIPQQTPQPASRTHPHLRSPLRALASSQSLQPASKISLQRPKPKTLREAPLPQNSELGRGTMGRAVFEAPASQPFKPLTPPGNRGQELHRSRSAATIPGAPTQVGTSGAKQVRQGSGSQSSGSKKNRKPRRIQKRPTSPLVYIIRLLILGIGIGAIAGTLISALNPATQASVKTNDTAKTKIQESPNSASIAIPSPLEQEILPLKAQMQPLLTQHPTLQAGVFIVDLDTGAYVDWNGNSTFASASTIKLPILVAFFEDVDQGKIRLDELLTMKPEMMAKGSGDLQYKQPGTQYTALEVATKMIVISDNTATNMLIARLGGAEVLNQRFRSWGLTTTVLRNPLPDVEGTNTTSPKELANLMSIVNQGKLISLRSRDRLFDIMQRTETNSMLPKGLGVGAIIAHKTGTIGSLLADVGLVDMPTGKRYIIAAMVKRPHNDASAEELIRQISRTTYDYFNQPRVIPSTNLMPSTSPATISRASMSENSVN